MNCSSEVSQLRKSGQLDEALARARQCFAESPDDVYLQRAYGWTIYELVKREADALENREASPGRLANRFNTWLAEYQLFGWNERPGLLHSLLLNQVLKGGREWPGLLEFARWWGPEFLRDDDRKPFELPNGKSGPSLELRFFYALGRAAVQKTSDADENLLAWAEEQLASALASHPDDQWLHYYQSKRLLDQGQAQQARECLLPVVRRQQRAPWVWTLLGKTFEAVDAERAITCYFRAVQLASKPLEVANTRISLAKLLVAQQRFDEATVQVHMALEYRTGSDYKVPQDLQQLVRADWYRERVQSGHLPAEPDVSNAAAEILQACDSRPVKTRIGVIDNQNPAKDLAHVAFTPDEGSVLHYRRFRDIAQWPVGTIVEVGFFDGEDRPCWLTQSRQTQVGGFVEQLNGELSQREGQSFGFLLTRDGNRVFVRPELMAQLPAGQKACLAIMGKDKHGRAGWRALRWLECT